MSFGLGRTPASGRGGGFTIGVAVGALVALVAVIVGLVGVFSGYTKTDGGHVAVVRNGGWFDDNQVRGVIPAGSSLTWIGFWSSTHEYPAQQRYYTITGDAKRGDRPGVDVVNVPTSDGVEMGIEGTIYFTLNLNEASLTEFDNKFGTRQFPGVDGKLRYPWDGDEGWSSFLDNIMRPVIDNDLRTQINTFKCVELVSSCALLKGGQDAAAALSQNNGQANNVSIAKVQDAINSSLAKDLHDMLGGDFFENIKFNLSKPSLPQAVQDSVTAAQAAQANLVKAQADAAANAARQEGYNKCPTCAQIDIMKAIPPTVTVYAPGGNSAVPLTPTK